MNKLSAVNTKLWEAAGVSQVTPEIPRRLLVSSQGRERSGKTDWCFRGLPDPMIYIGLDFGHEGVIEKHASQKTIGAWVYNIPPVASQDKYLSMWKGVEEKIMKCMTLPGLRSLILDSGTEVWELLRLAQFGTLNPRGDVKQLYPAVNAAYRSLIKMAYDTEINLVVTHKVKKEYVSRTIQSQKGPVTTEVWEGGYERTGFGEGGYLVQCQIEHMFDADRVVKGSKDPLADKFGIRVLDSRQNMAIVGTELWGEDNNFPTLASLVFDNSPEDWIG